MKRKSYILFFIPLVIILCSCDRNKKDNIDDINIEDLYIFEVKELTDWDYWAVSKDGSSFFVQIVNSQPSVIYYKPFKEKDGYLIFLNDNGIPSEAVIQDHIFLFGNFRKNLMDVSVILPDSNFKVFRDIPVEYDFTTSTNKSDQIQQSDNFLRWIGHTLSAVACSIGYIAVASPGGTILIAITSGLGCASAVIELLDEVLPEKYFKIPSTEFSAAYTYLSCLDLSTNGLISCFTAVHSVGIALYLDAKEEIQANGSIIGEAIWFMDHGLKVETKPVQFVSYDAATVGGEIISADDIWAVTEKGVYWGTSEYPEDSGKKMKIDDRNGIFSTLLSGLVPNTQYFIKAYAINLKGEVLGSQQTFKTIASTITDIENNIYPIVTIHTQVWMAENLTTTLFNDGTAIPLIEDTIEWVDSRTPGYCWYNNDMGEYKDTYGALYNWYTVNTGKLCPIGWHVPSWLEWDEMILYLGESIAGGRLKEIGTAHWECTDPLVSNDTRFTALPGGLRLGDYFGEFGQIKYEGTWWTSSPVNYILMPTHAFYYYILCSGNKVIKWDYPITGGFSVRCIKN